MWLLQLASLASWPSAAADGRTQYCVVGAGPAGVQLAAQFEASGRDYVVLVRASLSRRACRHAGRVADPGARRSGATPPASSSGATRATGS